MTDESLNARLDRIEGRLQNLDTRLAAVEHILPTLAARDDLERFATKEDLERFATKETVRPRGGREVGR